MPAHDEKLRGLRRFLAESFAADELRRLIRGLPDGDAIAYELPGAIASLAQLLERMIELLLLHRAINEHLFGLLIGARPNRRAEIEALARALPAAWLAQAYALARPLLGPTSTLEWEVEGACAVAHVVAADPGELLRALDNLAPPDPARAVIVWSERVGNSKNSAKPAPRPEGGRLLVAMAAPWTLELAQALPAALDATLAAGLQSFDRERDCRTVASLLCLSAMLAESPHPTALVLVCGAREGRLAFADGDRVHDIAPDALAQTLAPHAAHLRLVMLLPLAEASATAGPAVLETALALHGNDIAAVVTPSHALPADTLVDCVRALFATLLGDVRRPPGTLLAAVAAVHASLAPHGLTRAGLRLFAGAHVEPQPFVVCPYRGLEVFHVEHQRFYFAHTKTELEICESLQGLAAAGKPRLFVVFGPSGSGKSSLVRAGVAARLLGVRGQPSAPASDRRWRTVEWVLGKDPAERVTAALADQASCPGDQLLVIVDQFEKILASKPEPLRLENLRALRDLCKRVGEATGVWCIVTLREDQLGPCSKLAIADGECFSKYLSDTSHHRLLMPPQERDDLLAAVERPAALAGLTLQAGLGGTMVDALRGEPGALPLLQYTLIQLWKHRDGRVLTHAGYLEIGGKAAISKQAGAIYKGLFPEDKADARLLLLALVDTHGDRPTRRTRRREDLKVELDHPGVLDGLLTKFVDARLLVTRREKDKPVDLVEVAHEALIREWPELAAWVAADREVQPSRERLESWLADVGEGFFTPVQVERAGELLARPSAALLREDLRKRVRAKITASADEALRVRRRERWITAGLVSLTVVATALAIYAVYATRIADQIARESKQRSLQLRDTLLIKVASEALSSGTPELALQLLREVDAKKQVHEVQGWGTRVAEALSSPIVEGVELPVGSRVVQVALSPDGTRAYTESQAGAMTLWDVQTRRPLHVAWGNSADDLHVFFDQRGARLVREHRRERLEWDVGSGAMVAIQARDDLDLLQYSPDMTRVVTGAPDGQGRLWNAETGAQITVLSGHDGRIRPVAFSGDSSRVISAAGQIWDAQTGDPLQRLDDYRGAPGASGDHGDDLASVAFSPDGSVLVGATGRGELSSWNASSGERSLVAGHGTAIDQLVFDRTGAIFFTSSRDHVVTAYDSQTGKVLGFKKGHVATTIHPIANSPYVYLTPLGHLWNWAEPATEQSFIGYVLTSDGSRLLDADSGGFNVWDAETAKSTRHERSLEHFSGISTSADGRWALGRTRDESRLELWYVDGALKKSEYIGLGLLRLPALGPDGGTTPPTPS